MSLKHAALTSWLHDCLAEDRSNQGLPSLFAASVRSRRFTGPGDPVLTLPGGMVDLPPSVAAELLEKAALYRRECELLHGSWVIAGKAKGRELALPVLLHALDAAAVSGCTFVIDGLRWRLNPALFQFLEAPEDLDARIGAHLRHGLPDIGGMLAMVRHLLEAVPGLEESGPADAGEMAASARRAGLRLHAVSVILLVDRSRNVRGVLDELNRIAGLEERLLGDPLRQFLGAARREPDGRKAKTGAGAGFVPADLSPAQQGILRSCASRILTLCHGPPGTGKTFTLAAAAIDHAGRGEPVLIVCRSGQAADVVERAIDGLSGFPGLTLRAGDKRGLTKLREYLEHLLMSSTTRTAVPEREVNRQDRRFRKTLAEVTRRSARLTERLRDAEAEGELFHEPAATGWWSRWRRWRHRRAVRAGPLMMTETEELARWQERRMLEARERLSRQQEHRLQKLLKDRRVRPSLERYRTALSRRTSSGQEAALAEVEIGIMLRVFPVWIVETDDVHRLLPLTAGLFSLVVLDEASQCDLASALPVLHRGRRALVSGDAKQLRHLSFLSDDRMESLARRHGLDRERVERFHFRRRALVDAAPEAADEAHFLEEHFRSLPELIRFSNERFYAGRLKVMSEGRLRDSGPEAVHRLETAGERDASGVNGVELAAAARFLRGWLEGSPEGSIGFLSPFRAQVDAFEKVLRQELEPEQISRLLGEHQLAASTAHGFQGDERDVMLLSLTLTPDCPAASRRFLERDDVFNVSITRARRRMVAITSVRSQDLPADSLLADWLNSLEVPWRGPRVGGTEESAFSREVRVRLGEAGCDCEEGHTAAGIPLDLLVKRAGRRIALDLTGQGGKAGAAVDPGRGLLLRRAGLELFPLSLAEWRTDAARCVRETLSLLRENPEGGTPPAE